MQPRNWSVLKMSGSENVALRGMWDLCHNPSAPPPPPRLREHYGRKSRRNVSREDMWRLVKYCHLDMAQSLLHELPAAMVVACIRPL